VDFDRLGFHTIVRQGNHFISGADGVWVLIEGPLHEALLGMRPGADHVTRLAIYPELVAIDDPLAVACYVNFEYQDWQRCRWQPGHELRYGRLFGWVKRREDERLQRETGRTDVVCRKETVTHLTKDYWLPVRWLPVVRARMRTGFKLVDGSLPERVPEAW